MAGVWNHAKSVCPERWRAPSQINRPCEPGFAQAYASCLRCGSWRSDLERRAGLCRRGRQRWPERGEEADVRGRMTESCGDSLLSRVVKKSLNAETQSAQRKIERKKGKKRQDKSLTPEGVSYMAIAWRRRGRSRPAFAGGKLSSRRESQANRHQRLR